MYLRAAITKMCFFQTNFRFSSTNALIRSNILKNEISRLYLQRPGHHCKD